MCCAKHLVACARLCSVAGRIENWRLEGDEVDDLRASPYYTKRPNPPKFNKLFAALYDLMLSKLTNMGYLIPSPTRTLKEIFQEKIYGTDKFLVSAELIAWLLKIKARPSDLLLNARGAVTVMCR